MINYPKTKVIRISEMQHQTLVKMKKLNVNVGKFIRDAIKEKIEREHQYLKTKKEVVYCPFSNGTIKL